MKKKRKRVKKLFIYCCIVLFLLFIKHYETEAAKLEAANLYVQLKREVKTKITFYEASILFVKNLTSIVFFTIMMTLSVILYEICKDKAEL